MTEAFILMAAMPPTLGHVDLINFSKNLADHTTVILVTRGCEPYQVERFDALTERYQHEPKVTITAMHVENMGPEGNEWWANALAKQGFAVGDYLVASEDWGTPIAEMLGGHFYPYDMKREIRFTKATNIREDIVTNWEWIIPEFQRKIQKRIVIFGAESTGKTTLTKALREVTPNSVTIFEYARELLEIDPALTVESMTAIWKGQKALQNTVGDMMPVPRVVFLDTDLLSTLGYWEFWDPETIPAGLIEDFEATKADFYIQTNSDIPFEEDPIRYGGDKREQTDDYWESVLKRHDAPYAKLIATEPAERLAEALELIGNVVPTRINHIRQDLY